MYIPRISITTRPVYNTRTGDYVDTENNHEMIVQDLVDTVNLLVDSASFLETDSLMMKTKLIELEIKVKAIEEENEQLKSREFTASRKLVRAAKCQRITKEEVIQVKN